MAKTEMKIEMPLPHIQKNSLIYFIVAPNLLLCALSESLSVPLCGIFIYKCNEK